MKRSKFAISRDKDIKAQKAGKRAANKNRETYYEYRENRTDSNLRKKLEWGGTAESSETGEFIGGENASSMYNTGGGVNKDSRITYGEEEIYSLNDEPVTIFTKNYEGKSNDIFFTKNNKAIVTKRSSNVIYHGKDKGKSMKDDNVKYVFAGLEGEFYDKENYKKLLNGVYLGSKPRLKPLDIFKMVQGGPLKGNQKKLDLNKNGKLDAEDFKMLRSKKMNTGGSIKEKEIYDYYSEQMDGAPNIMYAEIERDIVKKYKLGSVQNLHKILEKFPMEEMVKGGGLETAKISELKKDMIVYPIYGSYAGKKGYVNKIMPDNKTVEVIFKNKVGNEYVKFEGNELTTNLKYLNGGELNETFPDTDAMSYAKGGGTNKMAMSYKLNSNDEHNISLIYHTYKDKMSIGELKQYISDELKINYFEVSSYMNRNGMMENGGSTSGWCYSIGGL